MKKEYIGKIIIGFGVALIAIPLLTAIIYDFSLIIGKGTLSSKIWEHLLSNVSHNVFLRWISSIFFFGFSTINKIHLSFQQIFIKNILCLLIPNLFIISGFYFLLKQNKDFDIKKCFNKMVIIGLAINILVLFNFFGLYHILLNRFLMSRYYFTWLSFIPRNILHTSVGRFIYNFSLFIVSLSFRFILVVPTLVIFAGYMQFFVKQEITSVVNENTASEKLQLSKMMLEFKGGVLPIFLFPFWFIPFMVITLSIALPWIICIVIRWICENTTIGGKRLAFKGTGGGLFWRYILWTLLTFITLGIYGYWAIRNYIRWGIENIEVSLPNSSSDVNSNNTPYTQMSKMMLEFKGGVLPIFLFPFWFIPFMVITLSIALPWIICIVIRWICENTTIGGKRLAFKGTGGGLFWRYILWTLLTFITLGIYGYWAIRNYIRWGIENIEVSLPDFSSVNSNKTTPIN